MISTRSEAGRMRNRTVEALLPFTANEEAVSIGVSMCRRQTFIQDINHTMKDRVETVKRLMRCHSTLIHAGDPRVR